MNQNSKIVIGVLVVLTLLFSVLYFTKQTQVLPGNPTGPSHYQQESFLQGLVYGNHSQGIIDQYGNSTDGFVLYSAFTVSTTSPVRAVLTNTANAPLICEGDSLIVFATSSSIGFTPSINVAVGTTTSTGYSANLVASTTALIATTTAGLPQVNRSTGTRWPFLLPVGSSVTLSVGDSQSAVSSSTYYSQIQGQVSLACQVSGN